MLRAWTGEIFTLCKNEKIRPADRKSGERGGLGQPDGRLCLSGQTVAQQIATLAALTAEDADTALQKILSEERMAVMYIQPTARPGKSRTMRRRMEE